MEDRRGSAGFSWGLAEKEWRLETWRSSTSTRFGLVICDSEPLSLRLVDLGRSLETFPGGELGGDVVSHFSPLPLSVLAFFAGGHDR